MCIAIYKPSGKDITRATLQTCWDNNNDGAGFMFTDGRTIRVTKELNKFNKFYERYQKATAENADCDFVIHFRIATHGAIDYPNCHPHFINSGLAFCHNGILRIDSTKSESDTVRFNKEILKKLPDGFLKNSATLKLLEVAAAGSKLIFLDVKGNVKIIGESDGIWDGDIWYSNRSYKDYPALAKSYPLYACGAGTYGGSYGTYGTAATYEKDDEPIINSCAQCGQSLLYKWERTHGVCTDCAKVNGYDVNDLAYTTAEGEEL